MVASLLGACLDDRALVAPPLLGPAQSQGQLGHDRALSWPCHGPVMAAAIGECNALELVPAGLVRVQIGRLAGQALHVQPLGGPASQEVLAGGPPVTRRPVPDHEPLTADRAQPHAQEADPIGRAVGVRWRVRLPQPAPVGRDAAAGAERVMGERPTQEGGRSPWRPGAYGPGRTARGVRPGAARSSPTGLPRRRSGRRRRLLFPGRPALLPPGLERRLVALRRPRDGWLDPVPERVELEPAVDVGRVLRHAKRAPDHLGAARAGPTLPAEALGLGSAREACWQWRHLVGGELGRATRRGMASQGLHAPLPSALEPLADGTRRHAERGRARRLFPAGWFALPGASPPPFAPVESGGVPTHAASVSYVYQSLQPSLGCGEPPSLAWQS
jgi:hypothetical protein